MRASRIYNARICRKYRPYVLIAIIILTFQVILAYSIYKINSKEDLLNSEWRRDSQQHRGGLKSAVGLSEEKVKYLDDDTSEDSDVPSNDRKPAAGYNEVKLPLERFDSQAKHYRLLDVHVKNLSHSTRNSSPETASKKTGQKKVVHGEKGSAVLKLDELNFKPNCDIVTKEAVSAINRAKSQHCKQEIANLTCLTYSNKLYASRLPRYCPSKGRKIGEYLGCYLDNKANRIFSGPVKKFSNNTPQRCIDLCLQSGFLLAGLQYGVECFCGDEYPSAKLLQSEDICDILCPGDSSKVCGGFYKMNVYHTGLSKLPKTQLQSKVAVNETDARVLYLLTLNGRAVRQVRRLIKALYHINSYFYIHVDARQDYMFRELLPLESQFPNIRLSRWRLATIWGGASLLRMMLHCMEDALSFQGWKWDFVINLSESDFPIKSHDELVSFLTANKGKNFLKSHGRDTQRFIVKQGLDKTFYECENRMWRIGDRSLPSGIRIDGGSDWVALSRDFCEYLISTKNDLLSGLRIIYQHTLLPAESFFHTVVRNSEFCDTFVDNNLHVTNWKRKIGCRCQYKHVVDWCGCSPNVFKPEDWSRIRTADSRPFYFARKFEPIINQGIIDQLEEWLYGPRASGLPSLTSYWQNEFHVSDRSPVVDDAFLTAYYSFLRLSTQHDDFQQCELREGRVLESNLYMKNDVFQGILVTFEAHMKLNTDTKIVQLETHIRPRQFYKLFKINGPAGRLKTLQVGTMYDQKEQLFRNYGQMLSPFSEPCLFHKWDEGEAFAATFVWVDPANIVAGSFEVKVDTGTVINFHKPQFQHPLRPGVWTVKFLYKWELMAETKFLIFPLSYINSTELIDEQQAISLNGGPGKKYIEHDFTNVEKLLGSDNGMALMMEANNNSVKVGQELKKWIDSLAIQFYTVQDTCYYIPLINNFSFIKSSFCLTQFLDSCTEVYWSSRYPDPKSSIGKIDLKTGRLER